MGRKTNTTIEILTDEQKKLVEDNYKLVYFCYKKLLKTKLVKSIGDDIIMSGFEGLTWAATHYKTGAAVEFTTYATHLIKYFMYQEIKRELKRPLELSLDTTKVRDAKSDSEIYLKDILADPTDYEEMFASEADKINQLKSIIFAWKIGHLTDKDLKLLTLIMNGYSYAGAAREMGCSRQMIDTRVKKMRERVGAIYNMKKYEKISDLELKCLTEM